MHRKYPFVTVVEKALPSNEHENSSVFLRMETEVWNRASGLVSEGLIITGWYHSHPNLGVFFSGTDRATQAAFFNQSYSLGLVIDPIREERKCFFGGSAEELDATVLMVV